jgi:flavin reductase (DIM6/NTAB) family NADH-FMN oxidoreductase RutF
MEINPADLNRKNLYKLMTGCIVPRPIGWISTIDLQGRRNLAPFSYFCAASSDPPYVLFCPALRVQDGAMKDTLRNVRMTGEFVVNLVTEALTEAMNVSSTDFPPDIDEFEAAGLTPEPASVVQPPRVAESPVHFECKMERLIELGTKPGGGNIVIGRVVHFQVDDEVLLDGFKIDIQALKPVGRLAGAGYCRVTDVFQLQRPRYKPGSNS